MRTDIRPQRATALVRARHGLALMLGLVLALFANAAAAQTRHALVIGIDDYAHVAPLQKARNDADTVEAALAVLGFQVATLRGPDRRAMNQALARLTGALEPGDEAVFCFPRRLPQPKCRLLTSC